MLQYVGVKGQDDGTKAMGRPWEPGGWNLYTGLGGKGRRQEGVWSVKYRSAKYPGG